MLELRKWQAADSQLRNLNDYSCRDYLEGLDGQP